jgi:hypothetical protein
MSRNPLSPIKKKDRPKVQRLFLLQANASFLEVLILFLVSFPSTPLWSMTTLSQPCHEMPKMIGGIMNQKTF